MSEKIYADISEDMIRRMRNWARAGAGLLRTNGRISSIYRSVLPGGYRYGSFDPPILMGEADDTDTALLEVPIRYRQAVQQFWRNEHLSLSEHARRLRPAITYHTFELWVREGHRELGAILIRRHHAAGMEINSRAVANSS
jgi:muconolactone delta-isomerase